MHWGGNIYAYWSVTVIMPPAHFESTGIFFLCTSVLQVSISVATVIHPVWRTYGFRYCRQSWNSCYYWESCSSILTWYSWVLSPRNIKSLCLWHSVHVFKLISEFSGLPNVSNQKHWLKLFRLLSSLNYLNRNVSFSKDYYNWNNIIKIWLLLRYTNH